MNKFLATSVAFLVATLAYAGYMSLPPERIALADAPTTVQDSEPQAVPVYELAPVHIEVSAPKKAVTKKRECVQYPMYGGGTEKVHICS